LGDIHAELQIGTYRGAIADGPLASRKFIPGNDMGMRTA
jgi:hypothetical protein